MIVDQRTQTRTALVPPSELPIQERPQPKLRVLVIEDDILIGMLFAETLAGMGHTVCGIAVTEQEAVFAACQHQPDLMLVDSRLGDGSGIAAVDEINARSFIPHVFVTGDKPGVIRQRPHAVIIEKPFRVSDLASAMKLAMIVARTPQHATALINSAAGE